MSVTPAHLRTLADRAEALSAEVRTVCDSVPEESPEHEPLTAARHAADWLARGANDLRSAATDLAKLQAQPCGLPWAVCPEHGNTLSSQAGISTCRVCRRTWNYSRPSQPCPEPVTWKVVDQAGTETRMCDGHVLGARAAVANATFVRLYDGSGAF
ncbi:hypothetical protein [Nonomuraea jiangxiensis]|uniref:Uncharacterized protein n=1 Tax=Nonomuraea jiangxiensis TaxID=633440 RepID=A0A1G8I2F9_9ACTN|nr:hypothetical protein [Nonomuraea jiangxiensis]SDI13098.1 hypothetical protein SAMN05421869_104355 [Nonomuraea jiangxiensis]